MRILAFITCRVISQGAENCHQIGNRFILLAFIIYGYNQPDGSVGGEKRRHDENYISQESNG